MIMKNMHIGKKEVGPGKPVFVIAEAGVNHNGSVETARRLIDAAADAGCDAVKFQKRSIHELLSREAYEKPYSNNGNSHGRTYGEHRERMELGFADYVTLRDHARERGILFMASAWDHKSASFVESLEVPAHKIGSPDMNNYPLCAHIANFDKPLILSTGMSELWEVDAAVRIVRGINPRLILMHCVSIYPTPMDRVNLGVMTALRERYGVPVGYSGHESGWHTVIAAVALGAVAVEKHITLDRGMKGGDHAFSLEPGEMAEMVRQIRGTEAALPGREKQILDEEIPFRRKLGKSITTRVPVPKGTELRMEMLTCKSPATGMSPFLIQDLVGKRAARDLEADVVLRQEDIA